MASVMEYPKLKGEAKKAFQKRMKEFMANAKNQAEWVNDMEYQDIKNEYYEYLRQVSKNVRYEIVYFPETNKFDIVCLRNKNGSDYWQFKKKGEWRFAREQYYHGVFIWTAL